VVVLRSRDVRLRKLLEWLVFVHVRQIQGLSQTVRKTQTRNERCGAYLVEFQKLLPLVLSDVNPMFDSSYLDITNGKQVGFGLHAAESEVDGGWMAVTCRSNSNFPRYDGHAFYL